MTIKTGEITTAEAALRLGVTKSAITRWAKSGRVKSRRDECRIFIPASEIDAMLPAEPTVSIPEAAKRLGCKLSTIQSQIRQGKLPAHKLIGVTRIPASVIDALALDNPSEHMSAREAAKRYGYSLDSICKFVASGKLRSRKIGVRRMITIADLEALKPPAVDGGYVTIEDAAKRLGCNRNTIQRYVKLGILPGFKSKQFRLIPAPALNSILPAEPSVTSEQAAKMLGRAQKSITKALRNGSLPGVRVGGRWRIPISVIEELKNSVSVPEASRITHLTTGTILDHIYARKLAAKKLGQWRIPLSALEYLTVTDASVSRVEAAAHLRVCVSTIQNYINSGRVKSKRIGNCRYIPIYVLDEILPSTDALIDAPEAARRLELTYRTLTEYTRTKKLTSRKVGAHTWVKESDLPELVRRWKWGLTLRPRKPNAAKLAAQADHDIAANQHSLTDVLYFRASDERTAHEITCYGFSDALAPDMTITLYADPPKSELGGGVIKLMLRSSLNDLEKLQTQPGAYQMTAAQADSCIRDSFVENEEAENDETGTRDETLF